MAKYCRKCGHKKEECTCKKSKLNYPMIVTIIITTLIVAGLIYYIVSLLIVKPTTSVSKKQENEQEEVDSDTTQESEKQEDEFNDWTQMISCTYLPKYNSNNYIYYYLKNNKVVRVEQYNEYEWATDEQIKMQVEDLKEDGHKNIIVEGKSIKIIATKEDKMLKEHCGDCTANDVYRIAENDYYEYGVTCSTKDNK
ncbi:MAG: hypothetical protein E7162_05700 [Firmicutes bacterium]|nr:hypothetical protein [Bacillota bacterium]